MKKVLTVLMALTILVLASTSVSAKSKVITRNAKVYNFYTIIGEHNKKTKGVRFIDKKGNIWCWDLEKGEKYKKGQNVKLKLKVKGRIFDWEILKVKKVKTKSKKVNTPSPKELCPHLNTKNGYLPYEEFMYNDWYDHSNVDLVYDYDVAKMEHDKICHLEAY